MKRAWIGMLAGFGLAVGGCTSTHTPHAAATADPSSLPTTRPDEVIARVDGDVITLSQLREPLFKAYGLNVLLHLVQLDLAGREAKRAGLNITPADIQAEQDWTVRRMFQNADDALQEQLDEAVAAKDSQKAGELREQIRQRDQRLLKQFLTQQRISLPEFELVMKTNAWLRKLAQSQIPTITEENLEQAWRAQYGEKVVVRHIQLGNLQEVAQAKARLQAGESFAEVAREMSRNQQTRGLGGELPAFSRSATDIPDEFKRVAFDLKDGQVSDPVMVDGSYHLLKLERRIAPKAVKFEDVKEAVRKTLIDHWTTARINQLRAQLSQLALERMTIDDPILRAQFQERLDQQRNDAIRDHDEIRRQMLNETPATSPASRPATAPAAAVPAHAAPATAPAASQAATRP